VRRGIPEFHELRRRVENVEAPAVLVGIKRREFVAWWVWWVARRGGGRMARVESAKGETTLVRAERSS